ncbi:uncharacterized protein LOC105280926 isoform X1 [Ooceraea biroi]|uniref:Myb/SANT-like DNA-binding domain-containing protein n=1 Tax=Ooceraea biroi TaxID=2015173 RepID=A0A026WBX6_OOCBI|nr:uncharacterized protein LOC105280926 isoform X1 [Ooceraea biroi]EZA53126.1 hypothetical protein X777_06204 [Ooceraea biroi]
MTKIKLLDDDTGNIYTIEVSEEDAVKIGKDVLFATQLLHNYKAEIPQNCDEPVANTAAEFSSSPDCNIYHVTEDAIQEETMSDSSQEKDGFRWQHEAILSLLTVYREHEHQITSKKMSKTKFWIMVASKLAEKDYDVTASQCKSKMAGLKNTYRNMKVYNSRRGKGTRKWRYFSIMDELFKNKPLIALDRTLDSINSALSDHETSSDKKRKSTSSCETELLSKRSKHSILFDKVLAIAQESIIERKKMHEEAMARQDKLLDILERIIEK